MDDFIRKGDRLHRSERDTTPTVLWNAFGTVLALGIGVWLTVTVASQFDPKAPGSWFWAAICVVCFRDIYVFARDVLNVTTHSIFFDLRQRRFGEVFDRRLGPPIERVWPLDAIEAIEIVKPPGIMDRLITRGAVAQIRVAGEKRPFVVCATQDPLKAKAVVDRVKTHLGRW